MTVPIATTTGAADVAAAVDPGRAHAAAATVRAPDHVTGGATGPPPATAGGPAPPRGIIPGTGRGRGPAAEGGDAPDPMTKMLDIEPPNKRERKKLLGAAWLRKHYLTFSFYIFFKM
jgi:hypothetical protein